MDSFFRVQARIAVCLCCLVLWTGVQCSAFKVDCDALDGECQPVVGALLYNTALFVSPVDWLVTVGTAGNTFYSADAGKTWTSGTSGTVNDLTGLAFVGNGRWVATGASDTMIYSDNGGKTWASAATRSTGGVNHLSLAFGNNVLLAVGTVANVFTSTDRGLNWTSVATPIGPVKNNADFLCGRFIFASNAQVAFTTDGTGAVISTTQPNFPTGKGACTSTNRMLIATGASPFGYYSDDQAVNWVATVVGIGAIRRVIRGLGAKFLAFGDDLLVYSSSDAANWSAGTAIPGGNVKDAVALDAQRLVAVGGGAGATIIRTEDGGGAWTQISGLPAITFSAVAYGRIKKPE